MKDQTWCPKLDIMYNESFLEKNWTLKKVNEDYALYPQSIYKTVDKIEKKKLYDYCFIGAFSFTEGQDYGFQNRKWVIDFSKNNFGKNSFFVNTTKNKNLDFEWKPLGDYDYTFDEKYNFHSPKYMINKNYFDLNYYTIMCQSKFCLCPAGDCPWSMRFYEALLCHSIPIIHYDFEYWRSFKEKELDYKFYYTTDENKIFIKDWVLHNYEIFLKYHTLEFN